MPGDSAVGADSITSAGGASPVILWEPDSQTLPDTGMARFTEFVNQKHGLSIPIEDYPQLHAWSIANLGDFWQCIAEFGDVNFSTPASTVLIDNGVEHSHWFPGATLNYAERALAISAEHPADATAVIAIREGAPTRQLTLGELRDLVACAQVGLRNMGVRQGDRVVGLVPNGIEALVAFLASASLGAIWSSCSPEFGADAVLDRFVQLEPTVLVAVDGYRYGGKEFDITPLVTAITERIGSLRGTVLIPYLNQGKNDDHRSDDAPVPGATSWAEFLGGSTAAEPPALTFTPVPFEHPLWVLFSSGTTGMPKGIVQGHGGILLEHVKNLHLHHDLKPGSTFFWFTTTGWMMWNYLVSGLTVGATVVLFDGSPVYPDMSRLWELAQEHRVDLMGVSAPFIHACMKEGLSPGQQFDLSHLSAIGSTGAPLSPEGFTWITRNVGEQVQVCSASGGTDVCTAFLLSAPNLPVWEGELSCAALGAGVQSVDDAGTPRIGAVGELVLTTPMPSMPVSFWNDADGSKLHEAYFDFLPGVWRHGDWCVQTERGSFVLLGRSDATLNRGGVRMGTAEFYRVAEAHPAVLDSLVVDVPEAGAEGAATDGELLCFLVLAPGTELADCAPDLRASIRAALSPRHVPDRFIAVPAIPKTLNGKKCEVPVKRILMGADPAAVINADALQDPASLAPFIALVR